VRKNGHLIIEGRPCKIVEISSDEEEVHFIGIDIFTGKKLEVSINLDQNVDIPNVYRTEYQFSYIDDELLHLIKPDGSEKNDVPVPEGEVGYRIREYEENGTDALITILSSMGEELAIAIKEAPK
jgi:translation initiation factor 5A